jgi:hypothetical protein
MQPIDSPSQTIPHVQTPDEHFRAEMLRYSRQTKNATVLIAWVMSLAVAFSLVIGLIAAVQLAKIGNVVSPSDITTCQSLGGSDPTC